MSSLPQLTAGVTQARLGAQWAVRISDLLDEMPDSEAEVRAPVAEIQSLLPAGTAVGARDHSVAAGRDVRIEASGGGVAAAVVHGNIGPPDPTVPGSAGR